MLASNHSIGGTEAASYSKPNALVQRARARRGNREQRREIVPSDCFLNKQIRCHDSDRSRFFLNRISLTVFLFRGTRHRAGLAEADKPRKRVVYALSNPRIRGPGIPRARANCANRANWRGARLLRTECIVYRTGLCVHRFFVGWISIGREIGGRDLVLRKMDSSVRKKFCRKI